MGRIGMRGTITEEVADVMKRGSEGCVLLQGQCGNSGGEDGFADRAHNELLMVVYKSVKEEAEEVFDDIGEICRRKIVHDA